MPFHKLALKTGKPVTLQTPFKVIATPRLGDDQIGVISNSHLFNTEDRDTYEELNDDWGLLSDNASSGSFDCPQIGEKIWLQIGLSEEDQSIQTIDVMHGNVYSQEWDSYPDPVKINTDDPDNPYQEYFMQIIAEVTDPRQDPRPGFIINADGSRRKVVQLLFADLLMTTATTTNDADQPGLELLVAIPINVFPGTSTDGSGDEIPPDSDQMTPYQLGSQDSGNQYDFELINQSDEDGAKVLIYDGVVYTANNEGFSPDGMPSDNTYIINVDDEDEIWVGFTYENNLNYEITSCWIDHGPETPDNDPEENTAYVTIGHVEVEINEPESINIATPFNEVCGDIFWEPPRFDVHFDFQIEDASEDQTPKVRIYDGVVYTANNGPADPDGMPSGNTYILDVNDEDEIWVGFTYENHLNFEVQDCWIASGPETPDDNPSGNTAYVTLGHVDVNFAGDEEVAQVYPFNEVCGDIFWEPPRFDVHFDFQIEDASDGSSPRVRIYDGVVLNPNNDPIDPAGMPSGNSYVIGVGDGDEIWVGFLWDLETDDEVSGDNINSAWLGVGQSTPDDDYLTQYVTIGHVDVNTNDEGDVQVYPFNEVCGDIVVQYPPYLETDELLQLSVDKDTGNVVWKTSKIAQITTEDVSGYTGGGQDFVDDIDVLTFGEDDFDVYDGGGGQAIVRLTGDGGNVDVQGSDGSYISGVGLITFKVASDPSANYITVYNGAGTDPVEVVVEIPLIPESPGGIAVLGDDDGSTQWFATDDCED